MHEFNAPIACFSRYALQWVKRSVKAQRWFVACIKESRHTQTKWVQAKEWHWHSQDAWQPTNGLFVARPVCTDRQQPDVTVWLVQTEVQNRSGQMWHRYVAGCLQRTPECLIWTTTLVWNTHYVFLLRWHSLFLLFFGLFYNNLVKSCPLLYFGRISIYMRG